jgi:OmpA-OmpF porin, OOP family
MPLNFLQADLERTATTMMKRLNPPPAQRLSAVAIAAALAAFAGIAGAQTSSGWATSGGGNTLYSGAGECVRTQANPAGPCVPMSKASSTSAAAAPRSTQLAQADASRSSAAPAAASAASGASATGGTPQATPGYVRSSDGRVVLSGSGQCVRAGSWVPANAAEPCERVARAELAVPPVAVAAPEPKLDPAPPPVAAAAPAPAVVEPPRPVIQKLTLSTDVLFDFGKAELKDSGKSRLDQLASEIKDADVDEIVAVGHADRIASEDYNQKLSEARAQAVKDYLAQQGAKSNVISAQGKGESQPVTGDDCKKLGAERGSNQKLVACLQPDRRVEIEVLGSRQVAGGAPAAGTGSTGSAPAGSGTSSGSSSSGSSTTR